MTTMVLARTMVVKAACGDERSHVRHAGDVTTLRERLQWILADRKISQRELARRSGLNDSQVGTTMTRLKANPNAEIERPTLVAIAKGGQVSLAWLATGEGQPTGGELVVMRDERYPNRAEAVTMAHKLGYAEQAIRDVLLMQLQAEQDPPTRWWLERIQERDRQLKDPYIRGPSGHAPDDA